MQFFFYFREYTDKILNIRKEVKVIGRKRQTPLERGWTSAQLTGKKYGYPEYPIPDGSDFLISENQT